MHSACFIGALFVTYILIQFHTADGEKGSMEDRSRLLQALLNNYMKDVMPDGVDGGPVVVNHSINIQDLLAWNNDVLTLNIWESMMWNDPRLRWSPDMFNGVNELKVPSNLIWQPDIVLGNSVDEYKGFVSGDLNAVVQYDGTIALYPPRIRNSVCYLPLNHEIMQCMLKYYSWSHSGLEIDLQHPHSDVLNNLNRRWDISEIAGKRNMMKYQCCPETYVDIEYTLTLRHR